MSRIGKLPIQVPAGVTVTIKDNVVTVKGPKGELVQEVNPDIQVPKEIKVETKSERNKNPLIILESADKQLLGQVCAKIRSFRMPEPYKGKGIKFVGEEIRRKSGKSAGK